MSGEQKRQLERQSVHFFLTAALVLGALLARVSLKQYLGLEVPAFLTFYPVIMLIAVLFGLWAGLLGTALAVLVAAIWVFPPIGQFKVERPSDIIVLVLFFFTGVFMSAVAERYRSNQRKLAAARQELALHETKERLEESSAYRRLALEAAELGTWDYRLDSGDVIWDEACRNAFGFSSGESLSYEGCIERIHPDDRTGVDEAVKRAVAGVNDGAYHTEFRVVWPDGSVHWVSSHGRAYFEGEGEKRRAIRFIGVNADITERKQSEHAIETVLQRLYTILSNLYSGVLLVTNEGRVEFINQACCDLLGLTESPLELAGLDSGSWIAKMNATCHFPEQATSSALDLAAQDVPLIGEEVTMPGGKTFVRDFVPLTLDGKSCGRLWVLTDISELKRTETRLRRFYETDLFAILYWRIDGGVVDANDRFLKMTGYTREDLRSGRLNWAEMTPPEYRALDEDARRQIRETGVHQAFEKEFIRKDGIRVSVEIWAAAYEDDRTQGVSFALDITERKRTEEELREAKRDWERTFNSVPDLIAILDNEHRIVRVNHAMAERLGAEPEVCAGLACYSCVHGATAPIAICPHTLTLLDHKEHAAEVHEDRLGGDFLVTTTPLLNDRGEMDGAVHVARDITESKRAEDALRESEKRYRNLFNAMNEGFCVVEVLFDAHGKPADYIFLEVNEAFERQTGLYDAAGKRMRSLAPEHEEHWFQIYGTIALTGEPAHFMEEAAALGRYYDVHAYRVGEPEQRRVAIVFNDFSDYKRAEDALRESEHRFRSVLEGSRDVIYRLNLQTGRYEYVSPAVEEVLGFTADEMRALGAGGTLGVIHPDDLSAFLAGMAHLDETGEEELEYRQRHRDGSYRWFSNHASLVKDQAGQPLYRNGNIRDITRRKVVEEQMQKLNRTLKALSNCNQALLHSASESSFLDEVCRIVHEDCGYAMVWIGFADDDERKTVRPVAWAGHEDGYLHTLGITWDMSPSGRGPTGTAIRTGKPSMCRNMRTDPDFAPWREEAARRGYASSLVIPLKAGDRTAGVITIYSNVPEAFSDAEVNLLTELSGDLAFGIHTLRLRAARDQAEEALRESEAQFRNLANAIPQLCWIANGDGWIFWYNQRWYQFTGTTPKDMEGWGWQSVHNPDTLPGVLERWKLSISTGQPFDMVFPLRAADGVFHPFLTRIVPVRDMDGKVVRWFGTNTDITEQKHAEDALRQQAELLDLSHDTIMVRDLDGTIRFWNHGAEEMYGYSKKQAAGKKAYQLLSTVFPQTREEIHAQVIREGRWEGELAQVTQDGTGMIVDSRWVLQRANDGSPAGVMELNTDITKRVQAEQAQREANVKLQSVLDSITDGLLILDMGWLFTYCSEHGARILGRRPEDLVGGRFWDLFPHADSSKFGEMYRRAVESRQPVHFEEFYPEPLNMWLECHCYPTEEGLSVYFRDISERKRTEEALLRSEKLASVGRMAATIAHEINNPLAAITNTLFLARMKAEEPGSVRQFLEVAEDELKRIAHITRQTLGFYRESSNPAIVSVNAILESAVDLMRAKIGARRASIEKQWDANVEVSAIAGELRQVFSNLLGNSLDAIDEGGTIKLRVSSGTDFKDGRRTVKVTVADNGKGIEERSKPHIFEPFFTTKGTVGTGLGLWVSKQIVDKHHGTVRMRSRTEGVKRGTVFMVILPVEAAV